MDRRKDIDHEIDNITKWVTQHNFERVAVQFPDDLLFDASRISHRLRHVLPDKKIFVLADSTHGSSSVDEVGAQHYLADCIVHVGPTDQQYAGAVPVLFVFVKVVLDGINVALISKQLHGDLDESGSKSVVVICDVAFEHAVTGFAASLESALNDNMEVLVASSLREAPTGCCLLQRWCDVRFGSIPLSAWWAPLGALAKAACAEAERLRICGRVVERLSGMPVLRNSLIKFGICYLGQPDSVMERRLLLRYSNSCPVWRVKPGAATVERIDGSKLIMQRYRLVQKAEVAATIGLLLGTTSSKYGQALADRLEDLAVKAGRRVYRFVVGQVTPEKLGNFPQIELFVSLASPENFPYNTRDFFVPIASPFELEVGLGARKWTCNYIVDLDELLSNPPAFSPEESSANTFGGSGILNFPSAVISDASNGDEAGGGDPLKRVAPARVNAGLNGVPSDRKSVV